MPRPPRTAIKPQNELLFQIADALTDGILCLDDHCRITYANAAAARMLGSNADHLRGTALNDKVLDEDRSAAEALLSRTSSGEAQNAELRLRAEGGLTVRTRCKVKPLLAEDGRFDGDIVVMQLIITDQDRTEARSLAAAIVASSDDAIVTKSLDGIIRTWNKGAEKMFGYTAKEAIGQPVLMLFPEDRQQEETEIISLIRSGQLVDHYETVRKKKDGSLIDVSVTISPLFDAAGNVIGASKVARDVTEEKKAAEAKSHLAAIVESTDDAIISKTTEGIIKSWNKGAEKIFGYTSEEMIGQPIMTIIPSDRKFEEADILSRICRGERIDHFETVRVHKDGRYVDVSVTISPIFNAQGKVVGASKVAKDITDQKRAHERMQQELEKLVSERTAQFVKANKELEGFTYSVSHDLRGPLRSIVASCMILREDYGPQLPAEAQQELDKQSKAAKKMADLIDDLLKLSRLGRQELKKTHLDITAIAKDLANEVGHGNAQCQFKIKEGMKAYGDPPTIRLLINNLLENACKFSNQTGEIEVGEDDGAFFVRDRGIGFDQQYAEKMFLPFERLVLDRDYPGTGIGLANVKRIVDRHGGKVWAESAGLGEGATFHFSLPKAEAQ